MNTDQSMKRRRIAKWRIVEFWQDAQWYWESQECKDALIEHEGPKTFITCSDETLKYIIKNSDNSAATHRQLGYGLRREERNQS
jgi:hypothetical protein